MTPLLLLKILRNLFKKGSRNYLHKEENKRKPGRYQACNISGGTGVVEQKVSEKGGESGSTSVVEQKVRGNGQGTVDTGIPIGSQQGTIKSYGFEKGFGFVTTQDWADAVHFCIFFHSLAFVVVCSGFFANSLP